MLKRLLPAFFILISFQDISYGQTARDFIRLAEDLSDRKKYDSAVILLQRAQKIDSTIYKVYADLGLAYYNLDSINDGFDVLSKAIARWPDSSRAYTYRGMILAKVLYSDEAIMDYTRALELSTNDTVLMVNYMNRGVSYVSKRMFQEAYEDYSRALAIDTANLGILNNLSAVLDELGRTDEAITYLKRIVKRDSTFMGGWVNIGFQLSKQKKYKEAIYYFDQALRIEPDDPLALNNRGYAYYGIGDFKRALVDINRSIKFYPGNSYAFRNRALVYIEMKNKPRACADLRRALELKFTEQYGPEVEELEAKYCSAAL